MKQILLRCLRQPRQLLIALAATLFSAACGDGGGAAGVMVTPAPLNPAAFVRVESGTLPVVISVPHGGSSVLPGVPERVLPGATTVLDTNTYELGLAVQAQLFALTGKNAHLVAAQVSRKYVDFNRSASEAYESSAVAPIYTFYHTALQTAVNAAKSQSLTGAILIDIHGQGDASTLIFRGTQNGLTADLSTLYRTAPNGLLTEMLARGLTVSPATGATGENASFTGGHIVQAYGFPGGALNRVNAVQLEFGFGYRSPNSALTATATSMAAAIKAHLQAFGGLP
jgi:N-formylglutamate amidohydrolase